VVGNTASWFEPTNEDYLYKSFQHCDSPIRVVQQKLHKVICFLTVTNVSVARIHYLLAEVYGLVMSLGV